MLITTLEAAVPLTVVPTWDVVLRYRLGMLMRTWLKSVPETVRDLTIPCRRATFPMVTLAKATIMGPMSMLIGKVIVSKGAPAKR